MNKDALNKIEISKEQLIYARILQISRRIGLLALITTFVLYISGMIAPRIPLTQMPQYWGLCVDDYVAGAGMSIGWSWLGMIGYSDFMCFASVIFLSSITIICYLRITPVFFKNNDKIYTCIAIIQLLVLILAASGLLQIGH